MRTVMALLLTLPLMACEPESVMERAGETLDDAGDAITDTIEDARDDTEEFVDEAVD